MRRITVWSIPVTCAALAACDGARKARPIDQPLVLSEAERVGELIFFDQDLSLNRNQSCAACHGGEVGGTGGKEALNLAGAIYEGSVPGRYGNRKPPSTSYATLAPVLDLDEEGQPRGGNFWDGRATGWRLGAAAIDQAQGPFLNPLEQALPSGDEVVLRVCSSAYGDLFKTVYGERNCTDLEAGYSAVAHAIESYEASVAVSPFSSKYDAYLAGETTLTDQEAQGLALFEGKAQCSSCHTSQRGADGSPPAFTDFRYDNIGTPTNPDSPFLDEQDVLVDGKPVNPLGEAWVDPGVGGFLEALAADDAWRAQHFVPAAFAALRSDDLTRLAEENRGKHRVPTLRNVDKRPRPDFVKAYSHNGWFKSLAGVVRYYNTRDVLPACASPRLTEAEAHAQGCWPAAEVPETVNREHGLGALGLTDPEVDAIVAFLGTLTDGWRR